MVLTCPKCEKENNNLIIDYVKECYKCSFCNENFTEFESLDYDWDKLILSFSHKISPEICLEWIESDFINRIRFEKKIGFTTFAFNNAFRTHFGISPDKCTNEIIAGIKRDLKINKLIN
jgi:hypothetical protein